MTTAGDVFLVFFGGLFVGGVVVGTFYEAHARALREKLARYREYGKLE